MTELDPIPELKAASSLEPKLNCDSVRKVTLWPRTKDEITVLVDGVEGEVGLHVAGRNSKGEIIDDFKPITPKQYKKYERLETAHLSDYPTLNERLLLCRGKGWNFDPLRNLMFDWPLDRECSVYAQIISGKVLIADLGYTG